VYTLGTLYVEFFDSILVFVTLSAFTDSMNLNTVFDIFRFPPMKAPAGACLGRLQGRNSVTTRQPKPSSRARGSVWVGGLTRVRLVSRYRLFQEDYKREHGSGERFSRSQVEAKRRLQHSPSHVIQVELLLSLGHLKTYFHAGPSDQTFPLQ
jgi:hypothetical protein